MSNRKSKLKQHSPKSARKEKGTKRENRHEDQFEEMPWLKINEAIDSLNSNPWVDQSSGWVATVARLNNPRVPVSHIPVSFRVNSDTYVTMDGRFVNVRDELAMDGWYVDVWNRCDVHPDGISPQEHAERRARGVFAHLAEPA